MEETIDDLKDARKRSSPAAECYNRNAHSLELGEDQVLGSKSLGPSGPPKSLRCRQLRVS